MDENIFVCFPLFFPPKKIGLFECDVTIVCDEYLSLTKMNCTQHFFKTAANVINGFLFLQTHTKHKRIFLAFYFSFIPQQSTYNNPLSYAMDIYQQIGVVFAPTVCCVSKQQLTI